MRFTKFISLHLQEKLTNKNSSSLQLINKDPKLKSDLHFGCLYGVKVRYTIIILTLFPNVCLQSVCLSLYRVTHRIIYSLLNVIINFNVVKNGFLENQLYWRNCRLSRKCTLPLCLSSASSAIRSFFNLCLRYRLALRICLVRKQSGIGNFIYQVSLTEII